MFSIIQVPVSFTHSKVSTLIGTLPDILVDFIFFEYAHSSVKWSAQASVSQGGHSLLM